MVEKNFETTKRDNKRPALDEQINFKTTRPKVASWKTVKVRTRRGRSKSVFVPGTYNILKPEKIWKLNSHFQRMKRHRGSLSLSLDLDIIEESPPIISNKEHKSAL